MFGNGFPDDWSVLKQLIWLRLMLGSGGSIPVEKTVTGAIVHITDALAAPLKALTVNISPIQDLHGYDNPWPAGGGKNLINPANYPSQTVTSNGVTFTAQSDGSIKIIGTATATAAFNIAAANAFHVVTGDYALRVTLDGSSTGNINVVLSGGSGGTGVPYNAKSVSNSLKTNSATFSATGDGELAYFQVQISSGAEVNGTLFVQLQTGSTADAWTPYSNICPITGWDSVKIWVQPTHDTTANPTVTIQLGQTVYGGTLDVTNGVLTVDKAMYMPTAVSSGVYQSGGRYSPWFSGVRNEMSSSSAIVCNMLPVAGSPASANISTTPACARTANGSIVFNPYGLNYASAEEAQAAGNQFLSTNSLEFCYELATPIEITLTPTEVTTLLGENNIWSDAGDVTVTYMADGRASDEEALNILLAGRYVNHGAADEATDKEALDILLGGNR